MKPVLLGVFWNLIALCYSTFLLEAFLQNSWQTMCDLLVLLMFLHSTNFEEQGLLWVPYIVIQENLQRTYDAGSENSFNTQPDILTRQMWKRFYIKIPLRLSESHINVLISRQSGYSYYRP